MNSCRSLGTPYSYMRLPVRVLGSAGFNLSIDKVQRNLNQIFLMVSHIEWIFVEVSLHRREGE